MNIGGLVGSYLFGRYQKTILTIVGVLFMFFSGCNFMSDFSFKRNAVEHTGTVFRIDTIRSETAQTLTLNVKYTVSGRVYESTIGNAQGWRIGDEIKIYYHRKEPSKIRVNNRFSDLTGDVIFFTVGFILLLVGRWDKLANMKKKFDNRNTVDVDAVYSENDLPSSNSPMKLLARFFMNIIGWLLILSGFIGSAIIFYLKTHPEVINIEVTGTDESGAEIINSFLSPWLFVFIGVFLLGLFIIFYILRLPVFAKAEKAPVFCDAISTNNAVPEKDILTSVQDSLNVIAGKKEISDKKLEEIAKAGANQDAVGMLMNIPSLMSLGKRKNIKLLEPMTLDEMYHLMMERWDTAKFGAFHLRMRGIMSDEYDFGMLKIEIGSYFDLSKFKNIKDSWITLNIVSDEEPEKNQKEQFVQATKYLLAVRAELMEILGSKIDLKWTVR